MDRFVVHLIRLDVEVRVTRAMPALSPALETRIDRLWESASARVEAGGAGRLFNGQVFSINSITPASVTGHMVEYRRVVAQVEDNALYGELGIRSLAACGVLHGPGGIAIGRRPAGAIYQPGMWQLCPAGSVDAGALRADGTMDYRRQLLTELHEELGLPPTAISAVSPLCIVEHPGSHICDFGMTLRTALGGAAILEAHRSFGNGEYDPIRIVPVVELPGFIEWASNRLVPPAVVFLTRAGLLPQGFSPPTGP